MGKSRWLIFLPVAIIACFGSLAKAEPQAGLATDYYLINQIPPDQSDTAYTHCGSEIENNINRSYDWEPFQDCTYDLFLVHMRGFITIPEHNTIEFFIASDDGGEVSIGGNRFGVWWDQGCSATFSGQLDLNADTYPLDLFMYENGGGTCIMLAWRIDDGDWEIVPEWAFTTASTPATTTTTTTALSTTVPAMTTTSTTVQETTTTVLPTTTEIATTVVVTTSTVADTSTTTTTEPAPVLESSTTTTAAPVTATTSQPPSVDNLPAPTQTIPVTTVPPPAEEPAPVVTEPEAGQVEGPQQSEAPIEVPDIPSLPTLPVRSADPSVPVLPIESLPEASESQPAVNEPSELFSQLEVGEEPSPEQALVMATSAEVLSAATPEQAAQIFEALDVSELDNTEIAALIEAVQDAPAEVRAVFEDTINIFGTGFDNYVPLGSSVPVAVRRTLIAVSAGVTLAAAATRVKR